MKYALTLLGLAVAAAIIMDERHKGPRRHESKDGVDNWSDFVQSTRAFFDANRGCPMFQLFETLDELYRVAYSKAPFPKGSTEEDNLCPMCFLICHRALLAAATATGSGLPEDGAAITRRALEAAKACLVVKADRSNFAEWKSIELRKARWESRLKGEKPKSFSPEQKYKNLPTEPLYQDLQTEIAILSDFAVHFTPEHLLGYGWEQIRRPDGTIDNSFGMDENAVPRASLVLVGSHRLIIRVFDRCLDGKLLNQPEVKQIAQRAQNLYRELLRREGLTKEAIIAGDTW